MQFVCICPTYLRIKQHDIRLVIGFGWKRVLDRKTKYGMIKVKTVYYFAGSFRNFSGAIPKINLTGIFHINGE